jgi:hypothetical protein
VISIWDLYVQDTVGVRWVGSKTNDV